ncbi:MAG: penicillin-binding protein 2, partial [Shimia sp.]
MKPTPRDLTTGHRWATRRGLILGGLQLGLMGVLAARMRQLQLDQADEFRLLAEENRVDIRLLPPPRGLIADRNGVVLAENEQNYRVVIERDAAGDVDAVLAELARLIDLSPEAQEEAREAIFRRSRYAPVTVAERLTWEDVARVSANAPALPGVTAEVGLSRVYPRMGDLVHIVGYVGPVSDYDLERIDDQDPLLQIPRFQIGKTGVERAWERPLRGAAGTARMEVNASGRVMRQL